ncbi:MAG: TVP38/TMEM64 family protein [Deltaproteobacteria bacterium]|nr:TVP38/TMEM64 family protein [Deltaproteobacteria bacterium]
MKSRVIILVLLLMILLWVRYSILADYITLENVKENSELLRFYARNNYQATVAVYLALYISVGFIMPGTIALTIAGGFLFGTVFGTLYTLLGSISGATLAFFSARNLAGNLVQRTYSRQLKKFNERFERDGYIYLLTLRMFPVFPSFMVNFFAGFTRVPYRVFFWTTFLGTFPGAVVYNYAGSRLQLVVMGEDLLSLEIITAFTILSSFIFIPAVYRYFKGRATR